MDNPSFPNAEPIRPTAAKIRALEQALAASRPDAIGPAIDYLTLLTDVLQTDFRLDAEVWGKDAVLWREALVENIRRFIPYRDEFVRFIQLLCRFAPGLRYFEAVQRWFSHSTRWVTDRRRDYIAENYQLLLPELFLYTIAVLIQQGLVEEAAVFLTGVYHDSEDYSGPNHADHRYGVMSPCLRRSELEFAHSLSRDQDQFGPTAETLSNNATLTEIPFSDLVQTDYLLGLRDALAGVPTGAWACVLAPFLEQAEIPLPLFARSRTRNDFQKLASLLGVKDKFDLNSRFGVAVAARRLPSLPPPLKHEDLMGLAQLDGIG